VIKEIDVWGVPLLRAFFYPTGKFFSLNSLENFFQQTANG